MDLEQQIELIFVLPKEEIIEELQHLIGTENGRPSVKFVYC